MSTTFEILLPEEIEKRSFAIIGEELGAHSLSPGQEAFSWASGHPLNRPTARRAPHSQFADWQAYCLHIPMQERI